MNQAANLWLYFAVVFGIIALPGLDMAFVMANSMLGGRRAGMAAVAGIIAGGFCHLLMGALGAAVVLQLWPQLFQYMLLGGAIYIAWMGYTFLRSSAVFTPDAAREVLAPTVIFRRAMLTSLLNPKAYIFMLAIFPQFLKPGQGPLWLQSGVLGAITAATQAAVYGALALAASQATLWFARNPAAAAWTARAIGLLLLLTAVLSAAQAWKAGLA
ncbi:LysE family translocator [Pseudoduganella violacea]|uniref:Threonine/homoserine/homoserine lactone efflux protein n=1 Tax=Pseudoduganella violacea TaxID=1715466 RepID=A0A7W5FW52_9BURK|nr:LysE family translocator [Pseudoduganella violacea]MBB3121459.1 threonine/homoserine/homoserine lactone efflux protein [Pseudoduganella violacea]